MKKKLWLWAAVPALLLAVFTSIFIAYSQPMENQKYNLSLYTEAGEAGGNDVSGQLGWTVYTQTGEDVTILTSDGLASFTSLAYAGQTFYYSRVMLEELDAPTIQLGTANRNFSVFLDGELLYTDCPELDNRIGYLTLPMREWDRKEDVTISLPEDYVGRTLTIAQSTPEQAETPRMATLALPASVTLYCSYAYESALIAESFQTACFGAVGYAMGVLTLAIFIRQLMNGRADTGLLCLALAVFLQTASLLYSTSYAMQYFGVPEFISPASACSLLMQAALLAFLSSRAGRLRGVLWALTAIFATDTAAFFLLGQRFVTTSPMHLLLWNLPHVLGCVGLVAALIMGWLLWRRESRFYRRFMPLSAAFIGAGLIWELLPPTRGAFLNTLLTALRTMTFQLIIGQHLAPLLLCTALVIVLVQFVRDEANRHAEKKLVIARGEMAQQSYENLRRHNEEVMMLRHDMNRHFLLLRQTTTDEKTAQYLDELIGQNKEIRPVVQTGNEVLDVILGSRLTAAIDSGVRVDVLQADAPDKLPMTDADLCSLVMNLIDNAIAAAEASGVQQPFLRLDLHRKNRFLVFICENSASPTAVPVEEDKAVPEHGLGLRIVHQIARRYGNLIQTEHRDGSYRVSLAIPLDAE